MAVIVVLLVTVIWSVGDPAPTIAVEQQPTIAACVKLAASFLEAGAEDNQLNMPGFQQGYRAICLPLGAHDGPGVRGPI